MRTTKTTFLSFLRHKYRKTFAEMRMAENQRIRLSKQLLRESLLKLMKMKSIYKISVTEICGLAEVNRSTFYKHYDTEFDLLKDIENEYLTAMQKDIDTQGTGAMVKFLQYIRQNLEEFQIFFNNTPDNTFFQRLIRWCFEKMWAKENRLKSEWQKHRNYVYQFILYGCLHIVTQWIENKGRETPEEINDILLSVIGRFFDV